MSYSFLSNITSLSEGVEFILGKYPYYDRDTLIDKYSDMPYSVQMILESMKGILGITTISKIVLFDALIGNSDRHHDLPMARIKKIMKMDDSVLSCVRDITLILMN